MMILCKQCGNKNSRDSRLCLSCGKRLDFNDPTLLVLDEDPFSAKPKMKVSLKESGLFSGFVSKFFFFLMLVGIYLMASTGQVPDEAISVSSVKSFDQKIEKLRKLSMLSLEAHEINVWIERQLLSCREDLKKQFPSFFTFQKAFVQVNPLEITLHFQFHLFQKPILISFMGFPAFQNNAWSFKANRARIGQLRVPLWFLKHLLSKIEKQGFQEICATFKSPLSLRIQNSRLELFFSADTTTSTSQSGEQRPPQDAQITEDSLLIQAADHYYKKAAGAGSQNLYAMAFKYYNLVLIRTPGSPLCDHAKKQILLCREHL